MAQRRGSKWRIFGKTGVMAVRTGRNEVVINSIINLNINTRYQHLAATGENFGILNGIRHKLVEHFER
jgi:hypothetical protein